MKIIKLRVFILILFYLSTPLTLAEDGNIFKEKIDINLEQKISENVQKIKETSNISKEQEIKLYKIIREANLKIRKEQEVFDNLIEEIGKGVIPICEKCLKSDNTNARRRAISGLAHRLLLKGIEYRKHERIENEENKIEEEAIISIAMRSLKDIDRDVRRHGVNILWDSLIVFKYNPAIIEVLKKVKREDEDIGVRNTASKALRQLGIKDAFTDAEWKDLEERGVIID